MSSQVSLSFTLDSTAALRFMLGASEQGMDPEKYLNFLMDKASPQTSTRTVEEVKAKAIEKVSNLQLGASFLLDDVAPDYRKVLSIKDRQKLGRQFRESMESTGLAVFFKRNGGNQAVYQRK